MPVHKKQTPTHTQRRQARANKNTSKKVASGVSVKNTRWLEKNALNLLAAIYITRPDN